MFSENQLKISEFLPVLVGTFRVHSSSIFILSKQLSWKILFDYFYSFSWLLHFSILDFNEIYGGFQNLFTVLTIIFFLVHTKKKTQVNSSSKKEHTCANSLDY